MPVTNTFSPKTVDALTEKVTATVGPPLPGWQAPVGALMLEAPQVAGTIPARRSKAVIAAAYDLGKFHQKSVTVGRTISTNQVRSRADFGVPVDRSYCSARPPPEGVYLAL